MSAYIIVTLVAYLLGSISFSVIISKKMAGFDVREKGMFKNPFRVYAHFLKRTPFHSKSPSSRGTLRIACRCFSSSSPRCV